MGVLACDRKDCEQIMCNNYSGTFGYLCRDCFQELKELTPLSGEEVRKFLKTPKEITKVYDKESLEEEFSIWNYD